MHQQRLDVWDLSPTQPHQPDLSRDLSASLLNALEKERARSAELSSRLHNTGLRLKHEAGAIKDSVHALQEGRRAAACAMLAAARRGDTNLFVAQLLGRWNRAKTASVVTAARALCDGLFGGSELAYQHTQLQQSSRHRLVPRGGREGLRSPVASALGDSFSQFEQQQSQDLWQDPSSEVLRRAVSDWHLSTHRDVAAGYRQALGASEQRVHELQQHLDVDRAPVAVQLQLDYQLKLQQQLEQAAGQQLKLQKTIDDEASLRYPACCPCCPCCLGREPDIGM